ncbi:MAG: PQQ-dependent sugar dehydrogenase [Bacteroidia bacterium]|nr:PQQ-dependent sugar dehydrogenase [Bacteroidia bacterium]
MKRFVLLTGLILAFFTLKTEAQTTYTLDSTVVTARVIKDSLDIPWEIIWGPDSNIWVTERFGRVSRINPETGQTAVLLDMSDQVYERAETGMLGMVLHPDFSNNPHVFIAYTYVSNSSIRERVVRFNYSNDTLFPADTLIEDIPGNTTHVGCRLIILPDNTLLMSTGDAQNQALPLNKNSVVGKILRMNLDGSVPADNPNPNSVVWSYGHRNAQGLWLAPNGILYSSEHGPTTDDELNILKPAANYGWPRVHGLCDSPPEDAYCDTANVSEPLAIWTPTIAPSDIIWYDHPSIPEWRGKLLMTVLKDKSLIAFTFNATGDSVIRQTTYFQNQLQRLRDICVSPEGKVYLATSGDRWANDKPFTHTIVELSNDSYVSVNNITKDVEVRIGSNPLQVGKPLSVMLPPGLKGEFIISDLFGRDIYHTETIGKNSLDIRLGTGLYLWSVQLENGQRRGGRLLVHE